MLFRLVKILGAIRIVSNIPILRNSNPLEFIPNNIIIPHPPILREPPPYSSLIGVTCAGETCIPQRAKKTVAIAYTTLLRNRDQAYGWYNLLAFSKCIFSRDPNRIFNNNQLAAHIIRNVSRYMESHQNRVDMFHEIILQYPQQVVVDDANFQIPTINPLKPSDATIRRIRHLVKCGYIAKAFQLLNETTPATPTPTIIQKMRDLHPQAPVRINIELDVVPDIPIIPCSVTYDMVEKALKKSKPADCSGCDNFHPRILYQLLTYDDATISDPLQTEYVKFLNYLIKHGLPDEYNIGLLHGLLKNPTDLTSAADAKLRPIAIDVSHARLLNKILNPSLTQTIANQICNIQCGLLRSGTDIIVSALSAYLLDNPLTNYVDHDLVMLTIDIKNAFNSIDPKAIRRSLIALNSQQFIPFFDAMHGRKSELMYHSTSINVETGVKQGSPTSSSFFILGLDEFLRTFISRFPDLPINLFYHDDGTIIGNIAQVAEAYQFLRDNLPSIGLQLQPSKCFFGYPSDLPELEYSLYINRIQGFFPGCSPMKNIGTVVLGVPITTKAHFNSFWTPFLDNIKTLHTKLHCLSDYSNDGKQLQLLLQRYCLNFSKLMHYLRSSSSISKDQLEDFDSITLDSLGKLLNSNMTNIMKTIAASPIRDGGFGLYNTSDLQPHARLACLLSTFTAIIKRTLWINQDDYIALHIEPFFPFDDWKELLPRPDKKGPPDSYAEFIHIYEPLFPSLQKAMTNTFHANRRRSILNDANISDVQKAIILSQSERGPNTLLNARWNKFADIRFPNHPFVAMCLYRLCAVLFPEADNRLIHPILCSETVCGLCVDSQGVHLLQCRCGEHNANNRHHEITRYLFNYLRKAGCAGSYEPANLLHGFRPDFTCSEFKGNKNYIFDLNIPNLCNRTHIRTVLSQSIDKALLADHNHKLNTPQGRDFARIANSVFAPIIISSTATPHSLTIPILLQMVELMTLKTGASYGAVSQTFFDTLYIRILRKSGLMIHSKFVLRDPD